ncbi:MAG: sigma-54-dependent transcriptional regulator [Smithellaceae bacterium]
MEIIGEAYRELQELVKQYAKEGLPVLFTGQTGSGKELFMELYKELRPLHSKKMTINCAALSDDLLRSEVFGHAKGAFTGAITPRKGKILTCKDGVLALDEIGDATPEFQAAILRVCEASSFSHLGSDEEIKTNTLIIAATNKPENLRRDLKERFHVLPIPPLQKEDIPTLAVHFLKRPLTDEVIRELTSRTYHGNIRELKKACERLKAEKGEKIFSKKTNNMPIHHFDYHRFRREISTWNRFIQPIIDYYGKEHGFEKYKYQYMPWDGDSLQWVLSRDGNTYQMTINVKEEVKLHIAESTEDDDGAAAMFNAFTSYAYIAYLKRSINEENDFPASVMEQFISDEVPPKDSMLKEFIELLRYIFDCSMLPCLLGYIYLKAEKSTDEPQVTIPQPHLSYLLDLPLKQAEKEFLKHYYQYNVKKYSKTEELEAIVGMNKKSLDQKVKRNQ